MNKIIEEYVLKTLSWVESGAVFLQEQLPIYVKELITYKIISNVFEVIVWAIVFGFSLYFTIFVYKKHVDRKIQGDKKTFDAYCGEIMFFWFITIPSLIASFFGVVLGIDELIKLIAAPRVFLIDYLKDFIK